jgi:hypothetical protein
VGIRIQDECTRSNHDTIPDVDSFYSRDATTAESNIIANLNDTSRTPRCNHHRLEYADGVSLAPAMCSETITDMNDATRPLTKQGFAT